MRAPSRRAAARSPPGRSSGDHVVLVEVGLDEPVDLGVAGVVDGAHEVADAVAVGREAQPARWPRPCRRRSRRRRACSRRSGRCGRRPSRGEPCAARAHVPMRAWTSGSVQWPATIVRSRRSRAAMNPNSRSPWAAWLRFMKSMSMVAHGMAPWCWVWRCRNGLRRPCSPAIHILAGENVCIHRISPTQAGSRSASWHSARMPAGVGQHGLDHDPGGDAGRRVQGGGDLGAVGGHRGERVRAVQVLAAGHEPDLGRARGRRPDGARRWRWSLAVHLRVALVEPLDEVGRDRLEVARAGGRGTSSRRRPRS